MEITKTDTAKKPEGLLKETVEVLRGLIVQETLEKLANAILDACRNTTDEKMAGDKIDEIMLGVSDGGIFALILWTFVALDDGKISRQDNAFIQAIVGDECMIRAYGKDVQKFWRPSKV